MNVRQFIAKREALDANELRMCAYMRSVLPVIGPRFGLTGEALDIAMETSQSQLQISHAHACLKAIERSLVPR